jgi:hypothetical protein
MNSSLCLSPKGAGVGDAFHEEVARVLERRQALGKRARRGGVARAGSSGAEVLVGTLLVVEGAEAVEGSLLGREGRPRWPTGPGLERAVHALVGTVLLGGRRANALVLDPEAHPPDVELGKAMDPAGGKRDTIVRPDGPGQAALAEGVLEHRPGPAPLDVRQALAGQEVAGVLIADGEGVALDAVPGGELPFEIRGPQVVGGGGRGHHSEMLSGAAAPGAS